MAATDEDNRTALHYAATIKDNGHFYNLLVHLGANPKDTDNVSSQLVRLFVKLGRKALYISPGIFL